MPCIVSCLRHLRKTKASECSQESALGQETVAYTQQHPLAEQEPQMTGWNGGISKQQFAWLADQLKQATADHERVIIACHHQLGQGEPSQVACASVLLKLLLMPLILIKGMIRLASQSKNRQCFYCSLH